MARLRVRLELNRRSAGVPLDKLASVVEETRKFFHLLAEDVHIEAQRGEWMASDFDTESLNFTAEYSGAVTTDQARAFGAAFAGATSLRRATISQFTRIADFLGEDELVGFGLYQADQEAEPSEWRCLSKRDAQRFGQEIQLLAQAVGESQPATALPAVMNGSVAGRRLFKDRREREALAADPSKMIREVESNLARRIGLLEGELAEQTRKIKETRELAPAPDLVEERFKQLLSAMETFWAQAPRQMAMLAAPPLAAPPVSAAAPAVPAPAPELAAPAPAPPTLADPAPTMPEPTPAPAAAEQPAPVVITPESAPAAPEPVPAPALAEPEPAPAEPAPALAAPTPDAPESAPALLEAPANPATTKSKETPARKPRRWWMAGVALAAAAVAVSFLMPELQHGWSRYMSPGTMPVIRPKAPAAPSLPVAKARELKPQQPIPEKPKPVKAPQRFEGPQIALEIPPAVRAKVPSEARVQVIVAIDDQGNVTNAEVESTDGQGARLLTKEALAAARRSRFRPAREGERAVESQMVLTYLFRPDSSEF
jgi:TonB family protein